MQFVPVESSATAVALLWEKLRLVPGNMLEDGRDPLPRHVIGLAKKHAAWTLREAGVGIDGGVWAAKCKIIPIERRSHQVHVTGYIQQHVDEGGAVLSMIAPELVVLAKR